MDVQLCPEIFSQDALLVGIVQFLTRRWARALMRAVPASAGVNQPRRESLVQSSWDVYLACLSHSSQASESGVMKLHLLPLDSICRGGEWEERCQTPANVSAIAGNGTLLYALGGVTDTWCFDLRSGEWRMLEQRPSQYQPEAVWAGGRLLVLGGYDQHGRGAGVGTNQVAAYCPEKGTWTDLSRMADDRVRPFACGTDGVNVYVAGGLGSLGPLSSVEVLDASSRSSYWSPLPAMSKARHCCAGALERGSFYAIGGHFSATCEALLCGRSDGSGAAGTGGRPPTAGSASSTQWTPMEDVPFKAMYCCATVVEDQVFAAGGTQVVHFDSSLKRWHSCPSLPSRCTMLGAALVPGPLAQGQAELR